MKLYLSVFLVLSFPFESVSFGLVSPRQSRVLGTSTRIAGIDGRHPTLLFETADSKDGDDDSKEAEPQLESMTQEEKEEVVGNLVADDEWNGLALELSELVRVAIVEDLKKNTREFTGKDDYKVGTYMMSQANSVELPSYSKWLFLMHLPSTQVTFQKSWMRESRMKWPIFEVKTSMSWVILRLLWTL